MENTVRILPRKSNNAMQFDALTWYCAEAGPGEPGHSQVETGLSRGHTRYYRVPATTKSSPYRGRPQADEGVGELGVEAPVALPVSMGQG